VQKHFDNALSPVIISLQDQVKLGVGINMQNLLRRLLLTIKAGYSGIRRHAGGHSTAGGGTIRLIGTNANSTFSNVASALQ
jgi:hypothetical protein